VYLPEQFRETRTDVLQAFVERHPLATLVAVTADGGTGVLRGHIARGNSLWRELAYGAAVLAIFNGADSYISPSWYPSKREHGKVVPTWNYATVHVHGNIRFIEDPAWLLAFVSSLTDTHERRRAAPWHVTDAPESYIESMLRAIVGLEITVTQVVAKFKGSQNRSSADRAGVAAGLRTEGRDCEEIAEVAPGATATPNAAG
jgi:transcriptional regulator